MKQQYLFLILVSANAYADLPLRYEGSIEIQQMDAAKYPSTKTLTVHKNIAFTLKEAVPPQNLWEDGLGFEIGKTHYAMSVQFRDKVAGKDYVQLSYGLWRTDSVAFPSGKKSWIGHLVCGEKFRYRSVDDLKLLETVEAKSSCTDASLFRVRMTLKKTP